MRFIATMVFLNMFSLSAFAEATKIDLSVMHSPRIEGDRLYIEGRIDSHIYDYFSYEIAALKKIKSIEFNSYGGNINWALSIAEKIRSLNITTHLSTGNVCASACVVLFAAGANRKADADTWLGIHGARLGVGYTTTFEGLCFLELEDNKVEFNPKMKGCSAFLNEWFEVTNRVTQEMFTMMEVSGVFPLLRKTYLEMEDDPEWPMKMNIFRKPDWVLTAQDALKYNLVTEVVIF